MHSATELFVLHGYRYRYILNHLTNLEIVNNCMINLSFQQSMKKGLT